MAKLTPNQLEDVAEWLMGTCKSIDEAESHFGIEDWEDAEDQLLDANTECCCACGWWFECCMLSADDDGNAYCDDCKPEEEEL